MGDLFTATGTGFDFVFPGFAGRPHRAPSGLAARRLGHRHAGIARATAQPQPADRLFFAVLPDGETAAQIAERTERWRAAHGLTGRPLKPEHLHVTLCQVGDLAAAPAADLIDTLVERAAGVAMPAFRAVFDRVMSFRNGAFVLCGDEGMIGLEVLQQRLSDALDATPRPARRFTPHLTLLRDERRVDEQPVERIGWTAREIVLVHSLPGRTTHRHMARIPLR